ncbi:DUF4396 domain-containing protein [Actinomycetospora soli]|uniref:DUF4396 domain-containing protein n=1 Tax=Actinomycetospora soli TaxID=2893887 RepID=UPI001E5F23E7|nr:DUF4396 domain-containing protein [Actinomycetospora soli]MCD2191518.1 DUF4396 domain-containing protein [Actinomycetospora soli]
MMVMGGNLPAWVSPVAWTYLVLAALSAIAIAIDVFLGGHRQPSRAMEIVWPVTALYLGPFALWAYARWARPASDALSSPVQDDTRSATPPKLAFGLPGGAASVIAHFLGVPLVVLTGWTIAGLDMWAMIAVIAVIALVLLFSFEYSSRAAASAHLGTGSSVGLQRAAVVAAVTIVAFDLGMVGWMVVLHLGSLMPPVDDASFVFLMQIGVVVGLATAYPVVSRLARRAETA